MFFISRSRHNAECQLWARLIDAKDQRIRELEAERRLLWDKICLLGIGAPLFSPLPGAAPEEPGKEKSSARNRRCRCVRARSCAGKIAWRKIAGCAGCVRAKPPKPSDRK